MFTLAPLTDLVDTLHAADIRAAVDVKDLTAPGVWVQPTGLNRDTLASTRVAVRLVLIVPDLDHGRATTQLVDLLNKVAAVLPISSAAPRSVLMPDGTLLPGLEVPFTLRADIPQE